MPAGAIATYERVYPFGWLGVLSETPPVSRRADLCAPSSAVSRCARCARRRAAATTCSAASPRISRPGRTSGSGRSCKPRLDDEARERLVTGPSIEKSIAPLRSFVAEPMRFGRLFLAGDAAHIVPPTGAKGLNLAASDVRYLSQALIEHYADKSDAGARSLLRSRAGAGVEGRALLLVDDHAAAPDFRTIRSITRFSSPSSTICSARKPPRPHSPRTMSACRIEPLIGEQGEGGSTRYNPSAAVSTVAGQRGGLILPLAHVTSAAHF